MPQRTITAGFYAYIGEKNGKTVALRAWQGETVALSQEEAERGDALGAFEPAPSEPASVAPKPRQRRK